MEHALADIVAAARSVARHWLTSLVNIVLMTVGLAGTCIFVSLSDAILKGDLGFPHAERLRSVDAIVGGVEYTGAVAAAELPAIAAADVFDRLTVMSVGGRYKVMLEEGLSRRYQGSRADTETLNVLGARPLLGRWFSPADTAAGAAPVAVISHALWQEAFGGDAAAIGNSLVIDEVRRQIVGVMPPDFLFPVAEHIWLPLAVPDSAGPNDRRRFNVYGTLRDGLSERSASVAVAGAVRAVGADAGRGGSGGSGERSAQLRRVQLSLIGGGIGTMVMRTLEIMSFLVYIVACVNAMGLLAGRAVGRFKEIRVRQVVGASMGRLLWQLTLEGMVIVCIAAACALSLAVLALGQIGSVVAVNMPYVPFWWSFELSPRAVWIALSAVPIGSVLVGCLPVLAAVGLRPMQQSARRRSASRSLGLGLVLLQTFIGIVLVTVAMGFLRTLSDRTGEALGFAPERFLHAQIELPAGMGRDAFANAVDDIERAATAVPGFDGAAALGFIPGVQTEGRRTVRRADDSLFEANLAGVSPSFFELAVPLAGSNRSGDVFGTGREAVVTAGFLDQLGGDGRFVFESQTGSPWRVVGSVADVTMASGYQPGAALPTVFVPLRRERQLQVLLRYADAPFAGAAQQARDVLRSAVPGIEVFDVLPLDRVIEQNSVGMPMIADMLLIAAIVASALAFAGLVGVVGKHAAQARREIGIRRSLGAWQGRIVLQIGGRTWLVALAGIAVGAVASLQLQGALESVGMVEVAWWWDALCAALMFLLVGAAIAATVLRLMDDSPYASVREN